MNSTSVVNIQGPAMVSTATAAMTLGTKLKVASLICVAAWKMLTTRPTTSTTSSTGALTSSNIIRPFWPVVRTCWASIVRLSVTLFW